MLTVETCMRHNVSIENISAIRAAFEESQHGPAFPLYAAY